MRSSRPSKSKRPSKQLLWFWMHDLFQESDRHETGLDIACGKMGKRRHFRTSRYIGADLDADRIAKGLSAHQDVEGRVSAIEDLPASIRGDFVVCLQTIGINHHFQPANTLLCVAKLIATVNTGGTLVFNIGFRSAEYQRDTLEQLQANFMRVEQRPYGAMSGLLPRPAAYVLACAMYYVPALARSKRTPHILFVCRDRRAAPIC
jgi:hypothetical protein